MIPLFYLATLIRKKYHICPKSLILNSIAKFFFNLSISYKMSPVKVISTYTIKIAFFPSSQYQKNDVWSDGSCWYPCFHSQIYQTTLLVIVWDHIMMFFNLHTMYTFPLRNPSGLVIKTSSSNTPFKMALFDIQLLKRTIKTYY